MREQLDEGECGCGEFFTVEGWVREHICLPAQVSSIDPRCMLKRSV